MDRPVCYKIKKMIREADKHIIIAGLILLSILTGINEVNAQITPPASQYYQNQYVGNPSLAGMDDNLLVNLTYRNQWRVIPGSPVTQLVTGDYRLKNIGVGLNLYSDKAGLVRRTRIMGTYAYHLILNGENQSINFGLSLGVMNERLDNASVIGDPNDVLADGFNNRRSYLDGDFGIAYFHKKLSFQAALPNMKKFLKKDVANSVDGVTYNMSFSYKIGTEKDLVRFEPKFCFRGARGLNNLWDIGTDMKFANNVVSLIGMYHSSNSSTVGFGLNIQNLVIFQGYYTSQLAALGQDTGGSFEIGLKIPLNIQKKSPQNQGNMF